MTFPPPPPDRLHLQYQPVPPPQQQPSPQMGPGGAYGPMQPTGQPLPGQGPIPELNAKKPGTITGIQVILYLFLAISAIGNVFSIMSMVEFFNPFSLIGLAFAVYSAIQSLASGVQIARGKRWAWIWSVVNAILGLALSLTGFIYGAAVLGSSGDVMLAVAAALVVLYGTLLGLLCTKSARQWILMHRIQRGEVQTPAMGTVAQDRPAPPQRPQTRPGAVGVAAAVLGVLGATAAWQIWLHVNSVRQFVAWAQENGIGSPGDYSISAELFRGSFPQPGMWVIAYATLLVCAAITVPVLLKGSAFGRIFGLIWSIPAILVGGYAMYILIRHYSTYIAGSGMPLFSGPTPFGWHLIAGIAFMAAALAAFIAMLVPGVKAWTPRNPSAPLIMMVPMGQQPPQQGYPQQHQQYPPRY